MPKSADSEQKITPIEIKTPGGNQTRKEPTHAALTPLELDWYYLAVIDQGKKSELRLRPRYNLSKGVIEIPCPSPARCLHMKAA